jgi:hypothetical protein
MKGLLLIYGDFDQLKRHTIEDPQALYVLDQVRTDTPEVIDAMLTAATFAMKRGLEAKKAAH